ncbi:MAG TPA: Holliday junction resolvase RuvX [Nitrospiraceae bacterium]|nr:Holliday junction resolvase RuvX [Nitrospiraceae bacterium]
MSTTGRRILALDPGTKRIGVALSDELGWTAQPLETFERKSLHVDVAHINELVRRHEVREIVIGMPIQLDGRAGLAAQSVQQFLEALQAAVDVPVVPWDERLTTKAAEQMLIEADVSRKKRKGAVDRVAAALLLKSYLEHLSSLQPAADSPTSDEV